jgi:uncharacterized membrane protein
VAADFYLGQLGGLLRQDPNWPVAVVSYVGYVAAVVYFAVLPALNGELLEFLAYATYDMTNLAILVGWSLLVSLGDMAWGVVITEMATMAVYLASPRS